MWSRRRARRKIRVDSSSDFDLELRLHDGAGGSRRHVLVSARDAQTDDPGRTDCLLEGAGVLLRLQDGRIVIDEHRGSREPARLSIPVESCVSADVTEVRAPDGSAVLRLGLEVRIGTFSCEPAAFALFFPAARRYRLTEFVHRISWAASPMPVSWTRTDLSCGGRAARPEPRDSSMDSWPCGAEDAADGRGGTEPHGRDEPDEATSEAAAPVAGTPAPPPKTATPAAATPGAEDAAAPRDLPKQVRRSGGNSSSSTFGRLAVTGVPDTDDWLSFQPLPSSSDVFTFRRPEDS